MAYQIGSACVSCGACADVCPVGAISLTNYISLKKIPGAEAPGIFLPRRGSAALGDGAQLSGFKVRADGAVRLLIHDE